MKKSFILSLPQKSWMIILLMGMILIGCRSENQGKKMGIQAAQTMTQSIGNAAISIGRSAATAAGSALRK